MIRRYQSASTYLRGSGFRLLVLLAIPLANLPTADSEAQAQACIDYGDYLHVVGQVETENWPQGVALAGHHAFVAGSWGGFRVVDVSNPHAPALVGGVNTPLRC